MTRTKIIYVISLNEFLLIETLFNTEAYFEDTKEYMVLGEL